MPPMIPQRILMTADTVGGIWTYPLELAGTRAPYDVAVTIATMGAPFSLAKARDAASIANLEVLESALRLEWMDDPWRDVEAAGEWLLETEGRVRPDIIHLNGYCHGALPWTAPTIVVGHSCVLSWWEAVKGQDAPREWQRYRDEVAAGIQAAKLVVAPSEWLLRQLHRHYGALRDSCVIYNGRLLISKP